MIYWLCGVGVSTGAVLDNTSVILTGP